MLLGSFQLVCCSPSVVRGPVRVALAVSVDVRLQGRSHTSEEAPGGDCRPHVLYRDSRRSADRWLHALGRTIFFGLNEIVNSEL